jgi:hypothetical protein
MGLLRGTERVLVKPSSTAWASRSSCVGYRHGMSSKSRCQNSSLIRQCKVMYHNM